MTDIIIDDETVSVDEKKNLLQAVNETGRHFIPHFCFHPTLKVSGSCRMCLVEIGSIVKDPSGAESIRMVPKLQPACNTAVREGLIVRNEKSDKVREFRKSLIELYLTNHPLDCPVCDKSGECTLQDYAYEYGAGKTRYTFPKRRAQKKKISEKIIREQNRCIHCGRCQQYFETYTGDTPYFRTNRGGKMEFDIFPGHEWSGNYQGNTIDLCPVGALTAVDFRFKRRVWFLDRKEYLCLGCANGCNIHIHTDSKRPVDGIMRVTPRRNDKINGFFMCDEGRFSHPKTAAPLKRLTTPLIRGSETTFDAALAECDRVLNAHAPERIAALVSAYASVEDLVAMKNDLTERGIKDIDYRITDAQISGNTDTGDAFLLSVDRHPNSLGAVEAECRGSVTARDMASRLGTTYAAAVIVTDPIVDADEALINALLAKASDLIVFAAHESRLTHAAAAALPIAAFGEIEGTFINRTGIPQFVTRAVTPAHEAPQIKDLVHRMERRLAF
ncbi:MAG: (2Fe-2S)-binding protein [Spirochaetes bacterium]|nr:(2Fe-2S)-binding protein [Spirochaetota bacterium]